MSVTVKQFVIVMLNIVTTLLYELRHEISNNVVYATSKATYAQSDQSIC